MAKSGNTTKRKQPERNVESNPDPIRDEKDLAEFDKLLKQEKDKLNQ